MFLWTIFQNLVGRHVEMQLSDSRYNLTLTSLQLPLFIALRYKKEYLGHGDLGTSVSGGRSEDSCLTCFRGECSYSALCFLQLTINSAAAGVGGTQWQRDYSILTAHRHANMLPLGIPGSEL